MAASSERDSSRDLPAPAGAQAPQPTADYETNIGFRRDGDVNLLPAFLQRYDRPQTRRAYENDLLQFFDADWIGIQAVRSITYHDVNAHIARLESDGYRPSTIKRRVAAIRQFFDWLVALEAIERNPANRQLLRRVRSVHHRDRPITFLTAGQASRLVEQTDEAGEAAPRNRALILTLLHCVLRRSEAAGMDAEHVRPLGRYWVLDLPNTKGGTDQYVKIPDHVVAEIDAMKDYYGIRKGALWRSLSNNSRGRRLSAVSIYNIVHDTARAAGLDQQIGAHTLRHTGCTLAIEAGASLQQVQSHARHKHLETTMVYVHQRDRLRDSAADFIHLGPDDPESDV